MSPRQNFAFRCNQVITGEIRGNKEYALDALHILADVESYEAIMSVSIPDVEVDARIAKCINGGGYAKCGALLGPYSK